MKCCRVYEWSCELLITCCLRNNWGTLKGGVEQYWNMTKRFQRGVQSFKSSGYIHLVSNLFILFIVSYNTCKLLHFNYIYLDYFVLKKIVSSVSIISVKIVFSHSIVWYLSYACGRWIHYCHLWINYLHITDI